MNTALTIAGSDSSGGAGIQADIKTMTANGVYAMSAITALTAQNTTGVTGIMEVTPEFLGLQLDAIFTDIYPDATKIGMVSSSGLIEMISNKLKEYKYVARKIDEYGKPPYPNNMLLILDDFLGSDLLENKKSPLVKILTKLRHYNITTIVSQQSTKGIGRTVRRLASDCALWKGVGYDDFFDLMKEIPVKADKDYLWQLYQSLKNKHDFVEFHFHCDTYKCNRFD